MPGGVGAASAAGTSIFTDPKNAAVVGASQMVAATNALLRLERV